MDQPLANWSRSKHQCDLLATMEHLPHAQHGGSHSPIPRPCLPPCLAQGKLLTHLPVEPSTARVEAALSLTSWPCVAHHDGDIPAVSGQGLGCLHAVGRHPQTLPPWHGEPPASLRIPPPRSHWGRGLTELSCPHPDTQTQLGLTPPKLHGGQRALPAARGRMVPCRAGCALGSPTSPPPPGTLTISCLTADSAWAG